MTDEQEEHLEDIQDEFFDLVAAKYEKGAVEHGGNIWELSELELIDNAIEEVLDQFVYLYTLKQRILDRK